MVAIFGVVGQTDQLAMQAIGRRLGHHGDNQGIWSPSPGVALGWRSGDPARASLPVPLVFAGSVLNRHELAEFIGRADVGEGDLADARLLWELYLARGIEGFALINGQFALALLDPGTQSLVLAVDRWAARPLHFAQGLGRGVFASESKALLALDDLPTRPNRAAISFLQAAKYLPAGQGPLADVHPVAPGSWVRLDSAGFEVGAYPPLRLQVQAGQGEAALAADLRDALLAAARRLVPDNRPIGLGLSAGLDSTLTLGAIRAVAPKIPIHTFTASYQRDDPDLLLAAEAARYFGAIHQEIIISADDLPQLLPDLVWAMEDPIAREEMVVYQVVAGEAAKHVSLVIYGQNADRLFAGMPRYSLVKAAIDLPSFRKPLVEFYNCTQFGKEPCTLLAKLLVMAYYRGRRTRPAHVQGAAPLAGDEGLLLASVEPLNAALLASLKHATGVTAMGRLHSQVGLRYGSIFHDYAVANCAFRIPDGLKISGRTRKYILRRAAAGILPPHLADRPKGLVRVARNRHFAQVMDAMMDEVLAPEAVRSRGLFDPSEVTRIRRARDGKTHAEDQFYHLWTMLLTEIWARTFIDGRGASPVVLDCRRRPTAPRASIEAPGSPFAGPAADSTRLK